GHFFLFLLTTTNFSGPALRGGEVRYKGGAWWFFEGIAQIWPDLLSIEDDCALVVVIRSSPIPPVSLVSKTGFLVLGWRALFSEISTSDSLLFLTSNEKLMHQDELPGGGGNSLLVVSPFSLVQGFLWLEGVAVTLMRRAEGGGLSSFPVTASVASISVVRVWCFGSCPVVLPPFIVQGLVEVAVSPNKSGFGLDVGVLVLSVRVLWVSILVPLNFRREEQRWLSAVIGVLGFDRLWLVGFAASVRPIVVCCELRVLAGIFALC
ncbi:LOW QUALITY PROTEIN: hypothetical protein HID58_042879, partial [Brassica napus]